MISQFCKSVEIHIFVNLCKLPLLCAFVGEASAVHGYTVFLTIRKSQFFALRLWAFLATFFKEM
jgi:hypothetical protein